MEKAFRKAAFKSKEDLAIKHGTKLLQKGDRISLERALTGFEHLVSEGSGRSMEPYASAVCQYSQLHRRMFEKKGKSKIRDLELSTRLDSAVRLYKTYGSAADAAMLRRLKAEQLYFYTVQYTMNQGEDSIFSRMKEYRESAVKLLDELTADTSKDPCVRDAIAYAKAKGIKPTAVKKTPAPAKPPEKPEAPKKPETPPKKPDAPAEKGKTPVPATEEQRRLLAEYCSGRHCSQCRVEEHIPYHRCGRGTGINEMSDEEILAAYRAAFPDGPVEKPRPAGVPQTLKKCLRCGAALSGKTCSRCHWDHTQGPVHLLAEVDPRKLQISK